MVGVAQLVRVLDCGSRCRRFEPGHPPNIKTVRHSLAVFLWPQGLLAGISGQKKTDNDYEVIWRFWC